MLLHPPPHTHRGQLYGYRDHIWVVRLDSKFFFLLNCFASSLCVFLRQMSLYDPFGPELISAYCLSPLGTGIASLWLYNQLLASLFWGCC